MTEMTIKDALKLLGNKFKRIIIENKHYQHIATIENCYTYDTIITEILLAAKFIIFSPAYEERTIKIICEF